MAYFVCKMENEIKKCLVFLVSAVFAFGTIGMASAETKKERWIKEQDQKIDRQAKDKKEAAQDKNSGKAWTGGGAQQQKDEKRITAEAEKKKKEAREAAKGFGSKGDEKYDPKKDKRNR